MRVLEVGAAKCWGAQHVIGAGCTYVGTDILADPNIGLGRGAFYEASGRSRSSACRPTARACPFADGAFDVAYCVATLHHALDLGRMVARDGPGDAPRRTCRRVERGHSSGLPRPVTLPTRPRSGRTGSTSTCTRSTRISGRSPARASSFVASSRPTATRRWPVAASADGSCGCRTSVVARRPCSRRPATAIRARASSRAECADPDEDRRAAGRRCRSRAAAPRSSPTRSSTSCALRGHEADIVSVPFKWYPGARVLTQAFLWRMLDLDEADGSRIDMVIATKFPSYLVRHADKRVWLVHQFRQAYELDGTALGQFGDSPEDRALRRKVQELDRVALGEASRLFAISQNVAGRLAALDGPRRRGAAAPAAGARLPLRGLRGLRPLGQPPRSREADRPPPRGCGARARLRGRDRGRRAGPRAARADSLASAASTGALALRAASPRTSSRICTRRASPSTTRRWTRTTGWCRSRRSSRRSPCSRRPTRAARSRSCRDRRDRARRGPGRR